MTKKMGADNTYRETNFNPEKMTNDIVSSILSHCKTNMELYRDRWLNDELPELEKQIQFEMLCDPDIYEISASEHFEREEKKILLMNFRKYFNSANYGHIDESDVDGFMDSLTDNWIE